MTRQDRPWAFVGGGSGGIGAATCRTLADDGWNVVIAYVRSADKASAVADHVRARGGDARTVQVDLTDWVATEAAVASCVDGAPVSGVVYAAGPMLKMSFVSEMSSDLFRAQLDGDAGACFNLLKAALPALRETRGAIAAVSTPVIRRSFKKDLLSSAPKAAIETLVRALALEEGRHGIRANCVAVGVIEDGMWDALNADGHFDARGLEIARKALPLGRFGTAEDVAEAVRFLISPRANWITGQTLAVDGGYSV